MEKYTKEQVYMDYYDIGARLWEINAMLDIAINYFEKEEEFLRKILKGRNIENLTENMQQRIVPILNNINGQIYDLVIECEESEKMEVCNE